MGCTMWAWSSLDPMLVSLCCRAKVRLSAAREESMKPGPEKAAKKQELHKCLRVSILLFLPASSLNTFIVVSLVATNKRLQSDWRRSTNFLLQLFTQFKVSSHSIMVGTLLAFSAGNCTIVCPPPPPTHTHTLAHTQEWVV